MPNCRDIPPEAWSQARQALVFYFSRRGLVFNAEDLAQQTLLTVWRRADYFFARTEDFSRVCYGFASQILRSERRNRKRVNQTQIDPNLSGPANREGPQAMEDQIFLREVLEKANDKLTPEEWELIESAADANLDNRPYNFPPAEANSLRVKLHRLRKKLARYLGSTTEV